MLFRTRLDAGRSPGNEIRGAGTFFKLAARIFFLAKTQKMRNRSKITGYGASFNITNPLLIKRQEFLSPFMLFFARYQKITVLKRLNRQAQMNSLTYLE